MFKPIYVTYLRRHGRQTPLFYEAWDVSCGHDGHGRVWRRVPDGAGMCRSVLSLHSRHACIGTKGNVLSLSNVSPFIINPNGRPIYALYIITHTNHLGRMHCIASIANYGMSPTMRLLSCISYHYRRQRPLNTR